MSKTYANPPDLSTHFGRLRYARLEWGKLQSAKEASDRFGWNENVYKSHEQGTRQSQGFKTETARKYARAFGVRMDWLLMISSEPRKKGETDADVAWANTSTEEKEMAMRLLEAAKRT